MVAFCRFSEKHYFAFKVFGWCNFFYL